MQLKDTLRMFNGLVERCFSECVTGFRSKALTGPEEKCVGVCAGKYLKHSVRRRAAAPRQMSPRRAAAAGPRSSKQRAARLPRHRAAASQ